MFLLILNLRYLFCISDSILDLYNRLFNHRPFLKGEVTHFVKEFETKRGDQEVQNLFETLEVTTELQSGQVEKLVTTCDDQLPTINANLLVAQSMCNKILDQAKHSELVSTFVFELLIISRAVHINNNFFSGSGFRK